MVAIGTFALFGIAFITFGCTLAAQKKRRHKKCLPVTGTLVEKTVVGKGRQRYNAFVVDYTVDGVDYHKFIPSESAKGKFETGKPIDLLYVPDDPGFAFLERTGGAGFMFLLGAGAIALALFRLYVMYMEGAL